jgi:hypothetical protein
LATETVRDIFFVEKIAFYEWVREQDEALAVGYEQCLDSNRDKVLETVVSTRTEAIRGVYSDPHVDEQTPTFDPLPLPGIAKMFLLSANDEINIERWKKIRERCA